MESAKMDNRIPVDKEAVLKMFSRLPYETQVGLLASMAVIVNHKTA